MTTVPAKPMGNEVDPFNVPHPANRPSVSARSQPVGAPVQVVDGQVVCGCVCGCGNPSDLPWSEKVSPTAARLLRCSGCLDSLHSPGASGRTVLLIDAVDPLEAEWDKIAARESEADSRAAAKEAWATRLPEKWARPLDAEPDQEPAVLDRLNRLRTHTGRHGLSLMAVGPYGTGKSWVAYSYARLAVEQDLLWPSEIVMGTEAEILEPLAYAPFAEVTSQLKALLNPKHKMFVIDDIGKMARYPNDDQRRRIFGTVINWIDEHCAALVMTTNLTLGPEGELARYVGAVAYERIRVMVGGDVVFREQAKRAELTAQWESEYRASRPE